VNLPHLKKKPYNPVLGETHFCWIKNDEFDYTDCITEQVSHHPPMSAYFVENKATDIKMWGNLIFRVAFGTNYASVNTSGLGRIYVGGETYEISKSIPDMVIRNVVWGKKYIMWIGTLQIECPETGYIAELELSENKNKNNVFSGHIRHRDDDQIIYELYGICGDVLYYYPPDREDEKEVLIDMTVSEEKEILFNSEDQLHDLSSLRLWAPVNNAIVENDMKTADSEKKKD